MDKMKIWFRRHFLTLAGILAGGFAGYLYWYFVGCTSGTCPITSSPLLSTLWGVLFGGLLFSLFKRK